MSKEEIQQDPITEAEVSRIWYKDHDGRRFTVIKYAAPYGYSDQDPERTPIYVAGSGHQPELLGTVLSELEQYRTMEARRTKEIQEDMDSQLNMIQVANDRITALENKRWWKL